MKVLIISSEFPPESPGGLGNAMRNLALGLASIGARPFVLSSQDAEIPDRGMHKEEDRGIVVFRIKRKKRRLKWEPNWFWRFHDFYTPYDCFLYSKAAGEACREIIRQESIDVAQFSDYKGEGFSFIGHAHSVPCVVRLATPLYMVERINRTGLQPIPQSTTMWGNLAFKFMRVLEQRPIREATALASPSASLAELITRDVKPKGKVCIIPTGIDTGHFTNKSPRDTEAMKEALDLGDGPIVLFTGRYEHRKGVIDLVEAFAEVLSVLPKAGLVMAGGDTETSPDGGSMKRYLAGLISSLGIVKSVRLLDRVPYSKLPDLYSAASVFAAPSLYENLANTMLEAMACGTPVISTTSGGAPEIIDDQKNGLLISPGDRKALADGIIDLLRAPERCKIIGKANLLKVQARFSREEMAKNFLELYESIL